MPELPEVESVRLGLEHYILDKTIQSVEVYWPRIIVTEQDLTTWQDNLRGQTIHSIARRGKYLVIHLDQGYLVSHLRMEGKYFYYPADQIPADKDKHTHVVITFTDGSQLHYHDVRKFGRMEWVVGQSVTDYFADKGLGPEPLSDQFVVKAFHERLQGTRRAIKTALLAQDIVVGLGNIYVDEALYRAGILPMRSANQLSLEEVSALHQAIMDVLSAAIDAGGSTVRTYHNSMGQDGTYQEQLQVYGRQGRPCYHCGNLIEKIQFQGRGTHYCPTCQQ